MMRALDSPRSRSHSAGSNLIKFRCCESETKIHRIGVWSECFQFQRFALALPPIDLIVYTLSMMKCKQKAAQKCFFINKLFFVCFNHRCSCCCLFDLNYIQLPRKCFSSAFIAISARCCSFFFGKGSQTLQKNRAATLAKPVCVQNGESNKVVERLLCSAHVSCCIIYSLRSYTRWLAKSGGWMSRMVVSRRLHHMEKSFLLMDMQAL